MALPKVWARKKFGDFVPLATLYLTYGLARARALLNAMKAVMAGLLRPFDD